MTAAPNKGRVLIVEDMMLVARDLEHTLQGMGYDVVGISVSGTQGVAMVARARITRPAAYIVKPYNPERL